MAEVMPVAREEPPRGDRPVWVVATLVTQPAQLSEWHGEINKPTGTGAAVFANEPHAAVFANEPHARRARGTPAVPVVIPLPRRLRWHPRPLPRGSDGLPAATAATHSHHLLVHDVDGLREVLLLVLRCVLHVLRLALDEGHLAIEKSQGLW